MENNINNNNKQYLPTRVEKFYNNTMTKVRITLTNQIETTINVTAYYYYLKIPRNFIRFLFVAHT